MSIDIAVRHRFPGMEIDVAFTAPQGVTALFGRSGAGKTTVVNAVAGLLRPTAGRAVVDGRVLFDTESREWLPPHKRRIGYVFQDGRLFPHLTVRQNLLYGRWFAKLPKDEAGFRRIVDLLGIGELLSRRPGALSGGEKQRVAIGRALLSGPSLLLMDEPLAALDETRKEEILPYLERIRDEAQVPILYVSHSMPEIARLATTMVALRDGRVVRSGPVEAVTADPDAVTDLGVRDAGSVLTGTVAAHHPDALSEISLSTGSLLLPRMQAPVGSSVRIRIEAQDVMLALDKPERVSALNILPVTVVAVRQGAGPGVMVQLALGDDRILARVTRRSADALGLRPDLACYAVVKSVSVARGNVGPSPAV